MVDFQNVNCFVFEHYKAAVQNIYNVFYFKTSSMCIFKAVKKQSYLHNPYAVVERRTNFVLIHFGSQPMYVNCTFNKLFDCWLVLWFGA